MKKLLQLTLILIGSAALSFTIVNAKCNGEEKAAPKTMKCQAGKCDSGKNMKCNGGKDMKKETNTSKPSAEKKAPAKGKCGTGKCS